MFTHYTSQTRHRTHTCESVDYNNNKKHTYTHYKKVVSSSKLHLIRHTRISLTHVSVISNANGHQDAIGPTLTYRPVDAATLLDAKDARSAKQTQINTYIHALDAFSLNAQ